MSAYRLSKSKVLSGLQCPKRLYLEVHCPQLIEESKAPDNTLIWGRQAGMAARTLYSDGRLIEHGDDLVRALEETRTLLLKRDGSPLFEAAFAYSDVLVRTDIVARGSAGFVIVEVKASTAVKDYHLWDCAVQSWVVECCRYPIDRVEIAHVDPSFVYPGNGDYRGLFRLQDVTAPISPYHEEIPVRVETLKRMLAGNEPQVHPGPQCTSFFECPFMRHCSPSDDEPEYPVTILPRGGKIIAELQAEGITELLNVPEERLESELHKRIHRVTVSGQPELDPQAGKYLRELPYPRFYLDFEAIQFAAPIWTGTPLCANVTETLPLC